MTPFTAPITLRGRHACLEPLSATHHDDLVEATRDGELWKLWYTAVPSPEGMRAEIERLGAKQDGILRSHQLYADGSLRDTVVYSIVAAEWPAVKQHLEFKLA
jgi:hypothetical protein